MMEINAVVLLSGGLDSTVALAKALSEGYEVMPLTIHYGQRHAKEVRSAQDVVEHYKLKKHIITELDLSSFKTSALTSKEISVPEDRTIETMGADIPSTYLPARNMIFLSLAAGLCESEVANTIFIGANALDYSGYPDCRPEFFDAFENVLRAGTKTGVEGNPIKIQYPLINLSKAQIVKLGKELNTPLHLTWSCYNGREKACGRCDSCILRLKGFEEAGYSDEIAYE